MLIVPTTELRLPAARRRTAGINWFPAAPFGDAVRVVIARQPAGAKSIVGVWSAPLDVGEELVVAHVVGPLNYEEASLLDRARKDLAKHTSDARSLADPAGFQWGQAGDRTRFWIVVAAP
jgi:hypothetical protein